LKTGTFKKVTRNDLVAGYLGQTAIKTRKVIEECLGGVLFIDEAYSLGNDNRHDSYSQECIDVLCEALSDHKDNLMVIIAGYEEELKSQFFGANPGLNSRFIWRFSMDPYTTVELFAIFSKMVLEQGWNQGSCITEAWFKPKKDMFNNFGRDMEVLVTYTKIAHGRRIFGKDSGLRKVLMIEDLNQGFAMFQKNKAKETGRPEFLNSIYV